MSGSPPIRRSAHTSLSHQCRILHNGENKVTIVCVSTHMCVCVAGVLVIFV